MNNEDNSSTPPDQPADKAPTTEAPIDQKTTPPAQPEGAPKSNPTPAGQPAGPGGQGQPPPPTAGPGCAVVLACALLFGVGWLFFYLIAWSTSLQRETIPAREWRAPDNRPKTEAIAVSRAFFEEAKFWAVAIRQEDFSEPRLKFQVPRVHRLRQEGELWAKGQAVAGSRPDSGFDRYLNLLERYNTVSFRWKSSKREWSEPGGNQLYTADGLLKQARQQYFLEQEPNDDSTKISECNRLLDQVEEALKTPRKKSKAEETDSTADEK